MIQENEGIRVVEARYCILCGCEGVRLYLDLRDRLFGSPGDWEIMQCPECRLAWLNPCPIPEDIKKLYSEYFTHETKKNVSKIANFRRIIQDTILSTSLDYDNLPSDFPYRLIGRVFSFVRPMKELAELSVMTLDGKRKGKLLDVGCGNGQFLAKMRDLGWDVVGVEPDGQAARIAKSNFGLSVFQSMLEGARFPDNKFDVITMAHVIEHVSDPMSLLRESYRVLKPGGKLVIVTPNTESLGAHYFGKNWVHWDPPRHIFLFSMQTLQACSERSGFRTSKLYTTSANARWAWLASQLIRQNGTIPNGSIIDTRILLRLRQLLFQAKEYGQCDNRQAGEEIVMAATKWEKKKWN